MQNQEIDLREIFQTLRRRMLIIVAVPLLSALTAGLISVYVLDPVYSASTTLWVIRKDNPGQIQLSDVMLSRNLTKTYAEVAKSRAVMADVIRDLELKDISVTALQRSLSVTPVRDTEILSFTVSNGNPAMAAQVANAVAEAFKAQIRSYMNVENVVVVDPALVPSSPVKPRPLLNVALAFVLGLMTAVGLAFLLEALDTSIKSPDAVVKHLGMPVLGIIPAFEGVDANAEEERRSQRRRSRQRTVQEVAGK